MGVHIMNSKLRIFRIVILLVFVMLVARSVQLQIVSGDYFYQLSEGNRTSIRPINAPRGKIMDRDGRILVSNKLSYNLYFLPNEIPPDMSVASLLHRLGRLTNLEFDRLKANYEDSSESQKFSSILLKRNIQPKTLVRVKENSGELPGVLIKESSIRDYVYGDTAAHILGYVGQISPEQLQSMTKAGYNYDGRDIVGITGLEKEYETYLNGQEGIKQIEVNSLGEKVRTLGVKSPVAGNSLVLNLDISLQKETRALLGRKLYEMREAAKDDKELSPPTGAGTIVMDVKTGKIRAMTSVPSFDLNNFAGGVSEKNYNRLLNDPLNPMLNRITMAAVPPGSIFK
jgi:penicillin-binding protein 2